MRPEPFWFRTSDAVSLHVERWLPAAPPRACLQIVHGMGEHAARYARLARAACDAGWAVVAHDQRGHGRSARGTALGDMGPGGWRAAVRDVRELAQQLRDEMSGPPLVLLGHSMGAFVAQAALAEGMPALAGCALSGVADVHPALARLGSGLAGLEVRRLGPAAQSPLLRWLVFGRAEHSVRASRGAFDWLSRDPAAVAAYRSDPLCGFVASARTLREMFRTLPALLRIDPQGPVPRSLPIRIFAGSDDPIGGPGAVQRWARRYQRAGFSRLSVRIYPGARHETLNELNHEEVERDLLDWLSSCLDATGQ